MELSAEQLEQIKGTIESLQMELKDARETISSLEAELESYRTLEEQKLQLSEEWTLMVSEKRKLQQRIESTMAYEKRIKRQEESAYLQWQYLSDRQSALEAEQRRIDDGWSELCDAREAQDRIIQAACAEEIRNYDRQMTEQYDKVLACCRRWRIMFTGACIVIIILLSIMLLA